jgi:hypothetical protein
LFPITDMLQHGKSEATPFRVTCKWNYATANENATSNPIGQIPIGQYLYSGPTLGGVGANVFLCNTYGVLMCVLEQLRVDNSSTGPNWEQLA